MRITCLFPDTPLLPFVPQKQRPRMEEEPMKTNVHTLSSQYLHRYLGTNNKLNTCGESSVIDDPYKYKPDKEYLEIIDNV